MISDKIKQNVQTRQISISPELYKSLKAYCSYSAIRMADFYEQAIDYYLENCSQNTIFRASYKQGYRLTVYLKDSQISAIDKIAEKYSISHARVIYTAVIEYIEKIL